MLNPRILSADILQKVLEEKIFFSELKKSVPESERAFVNQIVLGTLRNLRPLEVILSGYLKKKIAHKNRIVKYLLLSAIYELSEMNTPDYAVIDSTVKNVKLKSDSFLAGMANAILRNVCRDLHKIKSDMIKINKIPSEFRLVLQGYDNEQIRKIGESIGNIVPVDLSVKENHRQWAEKLNADILPNGTLRLKQGGKIAELSGFDQGKWWVQDVAASLPAIVAGNLNGKIVADLCAAPGGKTAQLALVADKVFAFDISALRLKKMRENMERLGLSEKIEMINADAAQYLMDNPKVKYDMILLDAPCSATGTFRRHPEVLHIKTIEDVKEQVNEQKKLLNAAAVALKKGGILIYSVCSIAKAEGEKQVAEFLSQNKDFKIVPIVEKEISRFGSWNDNFIDVNGAIRTLPFYEQNIGGMDAFFICKLQKIN